MSDSKIIESSMATAGDWIIQIVSIVVMATILYLVIRLLILGIKLLKKKLKE